MEDSDDDEEFLPQPHYGKNKESRNLDHLINTMQADTCNPCSFNIFPFQIAKKSRSCQLCNYEMQRPTWKGVVVCSNHGVRLCTNVVPPCQASLPTLNKLDGSKVTDYSWTCPTEGSCWTKFHEFYEPKGLFTKKALNLNEGKIKFGGFVYTSELYQKKYAALGIEIKTKEGRTEGMGRINPKQHMGKEK